MIGENKSREKLWKGIKGESQTMTAGGKPDVGNIAFTANATEGDTFTINSTVFTFWDSGNEPGTDASVEITIGGTLALTLATCETKVEAHATVGKAAGVVVNADVTNTDADLTMSVAPGVDGTTLVSSTNGANTTDTQFTGYAQAPSVELDLVAKTLVKLEWLDDSSTAGYIMLGTGYEGQEVDVYNVSQAQAGDSIYVYGDFGSNNLAYAQAAGDYGTLKYISGEWRLFGSGGTNGLVLSASSAAAL